MKRIFVIIITSFIFLMPICSWAGTYYVRMGASGNWAGAVNRDTPCGFVTANANAVAGDIVIYINDGGTFINNPATQDDYIINPANSGTSGRPITFRGEAGTTVILDAKNMATINLRGKSYIDIDNFTINNAQLSYMWVDLKNYNGGTSSAHITISNCIFNSVRNYWAGIYVDGNNSYITIQNCTFNGGIGAIGGHNDLVYFVAGAADRSIHHCLVENNTFYGGAHVALEFQTGGGSLENNVIRNNTIRNPNHISINIYGQGGAGSDKNLIENNTICDAGSICSINSCTENVWGSSSDKATRRSNHPNFQLYGNNNIIRYNVMYNGGSGIVADQYAYNNRIYNNVFYKNAMGLYLNSSYNIAGNVFANNIFKDNNLSCERANYPVNVNSIPKSPCTNEWKYNNINDSNNIFYSDCVYSYGSRTLAYLEPNIPAIWHNNITSDPLFVNASAYDFHLQPPSAAIDAGAALTTLAAGDIGTGTSLLVNDARYFHDGKGIVQADWIAVGNTSNTVQISSINYSTNTITLMNSISRNVGDKVWLYKDSDGTVVLMGLAPDIGAYEYESSISSPKNLKILLQ